ncbi:MAG: ABC transporter substrate-binding protein [Chloroflexota bacterium]|nr:ABC transporter substrate-binding protein [Chloroflexota bacterium]
MKGKVWTVVAAITALGLVVSCKPAPPAEPIKIGIVAPLSGPVKLVGEDIRDGALMVVEEWNEKGGVLGRPIEVVLGDTECASKAASDVANKLVFEDKVKYVAGGACSSACIPMSEVYDPNKVVYISSVATDPDVTINPDGSNKPYIFRVCFLDSFQGYVDAKFAVEELGCKKAAILYDVGNDYVLGLSEFFRDAFKELGGEVAVFEAYTEADVDFTALLTMADEKGADVLFIPDYYNKANLIGSQYRAGGMKQAIMGADGWQTEDLDCEVLDGAYFSAHFSPDDPRPVVVEHLAAFKEKYGREASAYSALGADAARAMLTGIEKAGVDDPEKVKDALAGIEFEGVTGHIKFDEHGDPVKTVHILRVDKDKGFVYAKGVAP